MKFLILAFSILISSVNQCKSQNKIIGERVNDQNVITVSKDSLINAANNILKEQNLSANLTDVSIQEDYIDNTNQKYYYVRFTNNDFTIKLVQLLNEDKGNFYLLHSTLERGTNVSCSGCRKGCDPKRYVDADGQIEFYCSDCTWGDTKDCKKTVTQSTLEP